MTTLQRLGQHAVLQGHQQAGPVSVVETGYPLVVKAIPNLVAYWRMHNPTAIDDDLGVREDGTYNGSVSIVGSLPNNSDGGATIFPGTTVMGTIPNHSTFQSVNVTLSLWILIDELQTGVSGIIPIVDKDASGQLNGDWSLTIDEDGDLNIRMWSTVSQFIMGPVNIAHLVDTPIHLIALAGDFGFELWINGTKFDTNTGFINGWSNNTEPIRLGGANWTSNRFNGTIDEIALYSRVLTDSEIISLSQQVSPPVAVADAAAIDEGDNILIEVLANDRWVGRALNVVVQVFNGSTWGSTATTSHGLSEVQADNRIKFTQNVAISADVSHSVPYRITDALGTSNTANMVFDIHNLGAVGGSPTTPPPTSGDGRGGTMVYQWAPLLVWTTGSLSSRTDTLDNSSRWTDSAAATVGAGLFKATFGDPKPRNCFNRAPTGEPSIELCSSDSGNNPANAGSAYVDCVVRLWGVKNTGGGPYPRHVRVVFEILFADSALPTTFRSAGLGSTSGSYPNYNTARNSASNKIGVGLVAGADQGPHGGGDCNWFKAETQYPGQLMKPDRFGARTQSGSNDVKTYVYFYSRPSRFGYVDATTTLQMDDSGFQGTWNRMELELFLGDPGTTAVCSDPWTSVPSGGNAFVKHYVTVNMDGMKSLSPQARKLYAQGTGFTAFCNSSTFSPVSASSYQNMDNLGNIIGFWINHYCGGSTAASANMYAWIRKIEVYEY